MEPTFFQRYGFLFLIFLFVFGVFFLVWIVSRFTNRKN